MLSRKKALQYSLDFEYYSKFLILKRKLKRNTESELSRYIIEKFIDDYETENGEIEV